MLNGHLGGNSIYNQQSWYSFLLVSFCHPDTNVDMRVKTGLNGEIAPIRLSYEHICRTIVFITDWGERESGPLWRVAFLVWWVWVIKESKLSRLWERASKKCSLVVSSSVPASTSLSEEPFPPPSWFCSRCLQQQRIKLQHICDHIRSASHSFGSGTKGNIQ